MGDQVNVWNPFFINTLLCCSAGSNLAHSFLLLHLGFLGCLLSLPSQSWCGWWTGDHLGEPSLGQWACPAEPRWHCAGREGQAKPGPLSLSILHLPASSLYFSFYGPWAKKYCDQASLAVWQGTYTRFNLHIWSEKHIILCSSSNANAYMACKGCAWESIRLKKCMSISALVKRHVFHSCHQEVFFTLYAATLSS